MKLRKILSTWWPLAVSWLLMGAELPMISAIIARLDKPQINLAAYGGVVFPIALLIEAPIIMLLAASTALSKDWISYRKLRSFMMGSSAILTLGHIVLAFTPIYYVVVRDIIGAPEEIIEPARIGLKIMIPWTWSIAYRRFNQGVMIRFGYSRYVGVGTMVRLFIDAIVLGVGFIAGSYSGIVVGTSAVAAGVICEALYVGLRIQPILKNVLKKEPRSYPELSLNIFFRFYAPLIMTSFLALLVQPIGSAAISRMPNALESLAVWPIINGLIFMLRSFGISYNEVVIAMLDKPNMEVSLRKFSGIIAATITMVLLVILITPASEFWLTKISALPSHLSMLGVNALWIAVLMPGLNALQSWYQGIILHSGKTQAIPEAVIIFLVTTCLILWLGVNYWNISGLYVALGAFSSGMMAQTIWLWFRSRVIRKSFALAAV